MIDMPEGLLCIWCNEPLEDATVQRVEGSVIRLVVVCQCGVMYSPELLEQADVEWWERIRARDGFSVIRDGSQVIVHDLSSKVNAAS